MSDKLGVTYKINVTNMTDKQHFFVEERAKRQGVSKAAVMKVLVDDAMAREESGYV